MNVIRDFVLQFSGLSLPISGMFGKSVDSPIFIHSLDPKKVFEIEMLVLEALGLAQKSFWKIKTIERAKEINIDIITISAVKLRGSAKETEERRFYFNFAPPSEGGVGNDKKIEISQWPLKREISWLHLNGVVNHEAQRVGLGVGGSYSAPGIKATLYVYTKNLPSIPCDLTSVIVNEEFVSVCEELRRSYPDLVPFPDPPFNKHVLIRHYSQGRNAETGSLVALTTSSDQFIKMRATWFRDEFIDKVATDWVRGVLHTVGRNQAD